MAKNEKHERVQQPKCGSCHHAVSFHGGGLTACRALGCDCKQWSDAPAIAKAAR